MHSSTTTQWEHGNRIPIQHLSQPAPYCAPDQPPPDSLPQIASPRQHLGISASRHLGSTAAQQHGSTAAHAALRRRRTCSRQPPGVAWIKLRRRRINIGLHTLTLPITIHSIAGCRSPRAGQKASRRYLRRRIKQVLFRCCSRHRDEHGTHGNKSFSDSALRVKS